MKKTMIGALTASILLTLNSTSLAASVNPYANVPHDDWSYHAVEQLVADGLVAGLNVDEYHNLRRLTRHDIAVYIAQAMSESNHANVRNRTAIRKLAREYAHELHLIGVEDTIIPEEKKPEAPKTEIQKKLDRLTIFGSGRIRSYSKIPGSGGTEFLPLKFGQNAGNQNCNEVYMNFDSLYKINNDWSFATQFQYCKTMDDGDESYSYDGYMGKSYLMGNFKKIDWRIGRYDVPNQVSFAYDNNINGVGVQWGRYKWRFSADAGYVADDDAGSSPGWKSGQGWIQGDYNGTTETTTALSPGVLKLMSGNAYYTPGISADGTTADWTVSRTPTDLKVGDKYWGNDNQVHTITSADMSTVTTKTTTGGYFSNVDANGYAVDPDTTPTQEVTKDVTRTDPTYDSSGNVIGTTTSSSTNHETVNVAQKTSPYVFVRPHIYSLRMTGMWGHTTWGGIGAYYLTHGNTYECQRADHSVTYLGGFMHSWFDQKNKWSLDYAFSWSNAKALMSRYHTGLYPHQRIAYMTKLNYGRQNIEQPKTWSLYLMYRHSPHLASYHSDQSDWGQNLEGVQFGGAYTPVKNISLTGFYTWARDIDVHIHNRYWNMQANWIF